MSERSAMDLHTFFAAAKAAEADYVLIASLLEMRQKYPKELKARHYIESKAAFLRSKRHDDMLAIFEHECSIQSHPQAIFYVWALSALNEIEDYSRAHDLLQDMRQAGYMIPNDTVTRLMYNLSCKSDKEGVLALYEQVDATMGIWTPVALNRLMAALGRVGCPEKAFQFYSQSTIDLDPSTFKTLMEICVRNQCHKEASDVLKNRGLFNIQLDSGGYNTIIEALLMLDRHDAIPDILLEMEQNGVAQDSKTTFLLRRYNYHGRENPRATLTAKTPDAAELDRLIVQEEWGKATELASSMLETKLPVMQFTLESIMRAYIGAGANDKIDELLALLSERVWSSTGPALQLAMRHFAARRPDPANKNTKLLIDPVRAMAAYRAAKFQNVAIVNPRSMFLVFQYLGDYKAALSELDLYMEHHKEPEKKKYMREAIFFDTLRVCVKCREYDAFEKLVQKLVAVGHPISPKAFESIWFDPTKYSYFNHGKRPFTDKEKHAFLIKFGKALSNSLRLLMDKQDFTPTYETLDVLTNTLYYSGYRAILVQLYLKAKAHSPPTVLPEQTYAKIIDVLVHGHRLNEALSLYKEAFSYKDRINQPWLLAAPVAQGYAMAKDFDKLTSTIENYPYPSVFRAALLRLFVQEELELATKFVKQMTNYDLIPNPYTTQHAMIACSKVAAKKGNPSVIAATVEAFLTPLESRLIKDDKVVRTLTLTNSSGLTSSQNINHHDIERTYAFALLALKTSGNYADADKLAARMQKYGIKQVDVAKHK
ncbi:hypothetical protein THRCLA_08728 [Thraustotheca clavata]|uniref:Pentacotripeptide-repeat region of PRORP domain-containing protein n=1 Tax=Thraustotheca clavata TaxID=74557 RepID=A0A1V9Z2R9_9STRA|nr:hypothetical protein THRCLA_08728 [Thraustotheca clavata]